MVSRLGFDALAAVALALTALLGAYIPAYLAKRDKLLGGNGRSLTYVLGNMLSAGVMVSAGFCHLLGEALKQMPHMQFPLAPFLCGTGYLFTLVADKIAASASGPHYGCGHGAPATAKLPPVDSCCAVEVLAGVDIAERGARASSGRLEKHSGDAEVQGLLHERTPSPLRRPRNGGLLRQQSGHAGGEELGGRGGSGSDHAVVHMANGGDSGFSQEAAHRPGSGSLQDGLGLLPPLHSAPHHRTGRPLHRNSSDSLVFEMEPPGSGAEAGPLLAGAATSNGGGGGSSGGGSGGGSSIRSVSFLTAVLMGVALCFHSLLEGAAMGAQPTISNSLHIFIAIVSHKGLAAYALGSSIVDSDVSMRRFWSVVLPFTFASPVGIFIGYVVSDIAKGVGAASISALASGTFLYVAFMEVIPKEIRDPAHMAQKLVALLVGFCLMSVLAVWA